MPPKLRVLISILLMALPCSSRAQSAWGEGEWKKDRVDLPSTGLEAKNAANRTRSDVASARSLFDSIRHMDLSSPEAADKLRRLGQEHGEVKNALENYEQEKAGAYFDQLNVSTGSVVSKFNEHQGVAKYLATALAQGDPISAIRSYVFSFLLDEQGFSQEAGYFFNKAEFMRKMIRDRKFSQMIRPLQFELPALYDALGVPRYTQYQYQVVRFLDDETFKGERFLVDNESDSGSRHLHLGNFFNYDTNVVGRANDGALPTGIGVDAGTALLAFANFGMQTSPMQPVNFGADLYTVISRHTRDDLGAYDTWTNIPTIWLSSWNSTNNEIRLRYDYAHTMRDRSNLKFHSQTHGPQLSWAHLWERRYQAEASYSYKSTFFTQDGNGPDQRSGPRHTLNVKISYPGTNFAVQPFLRYAFDHDWAKGSRFQANTHAVEIGTSYLVGRWLTLKFGTEYSISMFPHHDGKRFDKTKLLKLGGTGKLLDSLSMFLDVTYLDTDSSVPERHSTRRWNVTLGPVFGVSL